MILEAHVDVIEKLRSFHYILSSEITRELFAFNILPLEKQGYLSAVLHWLDAQPLAVEPEGRLLADEIRVMGEDFLIQANGERA